MVSEVKRWEIEMKKSCENSELVAAEPPILAEVGQHHKTPKLAKVGLARVGLAKVGLTLRRTPPPPLPDLEKVGAQKGVAPKGGGPKFRSFVSVARRNFHFSSLFLGSFR